MKEPFPPTVMVNALLTVELSVLILRNALFVRQITF